jgi:hypothetical protein
MSALSVQVPFPVFYDRAGEPLENGYVWIGQANLNPQTNPIQVYFDKNLTQPAAQPLRTLAGYISNAGTPAQIYVDAVNFSILVQDKNGTMVYQFADGVYVATNAVNVAFTGANGQDGTVADIADPDGADWIGFTGYKAQAGTVENLAGDDGSDWIGFEPSATGSIVRSAQDKMRDNANINDFGGNGDGIAINNSAFSLMATAYGYVVFPEGDFVLNTRNIDVPIYFSAGAAITVPTGNTITIRNRITASNKQQIFKGDGDIRLENDNALGIGEDSRHVYAAWWGIFPVGQAATIQTALFNKALGAFTSQTREGIFELDIGSYRIDGKVTIPRGVHLKGAGTRRTVFDLVDDGYTALESGGAAVKITGVQFEQPTGSFSYFDGIQIGLLHDTCVLEDIRLWNPRVGIYIGPAGTRTSVNQVVCVNNSEPGGGYPADSAVVWVQATNVLLEDIQLTNTSFGQDCVVLLGFGNTSAMQNTIINDIGCTEKSTPVKIVADTENIQNTAICNVVFFGGTGDTIDGVIEVETSGTASVQGLSMNNICSNSLASALLKMTQGSSGSTLAVTLASGTAFSSNTQAANLTQTAGTMSKIVIAHGVAAFSATPPVSSTGTITDLEIASYM